LRGSVVLAHGGSTVIVRSMTREGDMKRFTWNVSSHSSGVGVDATVVVDAPDYDEAMKIADRSPCRSLNLGLYRVEVENNPVGRPVSLSEALAISKDISDKAEARRVKAYENDPDSCGGEE